MSLKKKSESVARPGDLLGYPRCALDYASTHQDVFNTLIERDASPVAFKLAWYLHYNLSVWNGNTHARSFGDIARDLKVSLSSVYRAVVELTELGIMEELNDGYGARFHLPHYVPMRDEAAKKQRENAESRLSSRLESWVAGYLKKHGHPPTARKKAEEEVKLRRELGLS